MDFAGAHASAEEEFSPEIANSAKEGPNNLTFFLKFAPPPPSPAALAAFASPLCRHSRSRARCHITLAVAAAEAFAVNPSCRRRNFWLPVLSLSLTLIPSSTFVAAAFASVAASYYVVVVVPSSERAIELDIYTVLVGKGKQSDIETDLGGQGLSNGGRCRCRRSRYDDVLCCCSSSSSAITSLHEIVPSRPVTQLAATVVAAAPAS